MANPSPGDEASSWTCAAVVERLYEFLDGELATDVHEHIREHLSVCRRCSSLFEYEHGFLRTISQHSHVEQAPPDLRRRILRLFLSGEAERSGE